MKRRYRNINLGNPLKLEDKQKIIDGVHETDINSYNVFGLVSCYYCNTTNPKDKDICSGCSRILTYKVKGQTIYTNNNL